MVDLIEAVHSLFGWSKIQHGTPFFYLAGDQHPFGLSCFLCFPGPRELRGGQQEASWLGRCAAWRVLTCAAKKAKHSYSAWNQHGTFAIKRIKLASFLDFVQLSNCQSDPRWSKGTWSAAVNLWATCVSWFPSSDWTQYSFKSSMMWRSTTLYFFLDGCL